MNAQNAVHEKMHSSLHMEHVIFDNLSFIRKGFATDNDVEIKARVKIEKDDEGLYRVILKVIADKQDEYIAEVQITGYCSIDEAYPEKDIMLNQNAVAILFPYVRAQLSLLTAQPGTDPIVLPVMNITAMLAKGNNSGE